MDSYSVQPGVRVLWCLRRRASNVRCLLKTASVPVEVQVLQDRDVVLTEVFQDEGLALQWADAYASRLRDRGWRDSP